MKYVKFIERFVELLTESENSDIAADRAFGLIAKEYRIGRVFMEFIAPSTFYTKGGDRRDLLLFKADGDIEEEAGYFREFHTGEGGTVKYFLYGVKGATPLSEEEKRELDLFFDILFFHCGRWRLINHVKKLSLTDSLTGLPNSGGFLSHIEELLSKKELTRYNAYYFNLARFSLINERFGVKETDTIIVRYSQELLKFIKDGECIGRLGGDNFVALILKERTSAFLELLSGVETYGMLGNRRITICISASAGIFELDETVTHCGMVIGECGTALDIAKHVEKKPFVYASEEIRQRMQQRKQLEDGFSEAINRGNFMAFYQPKVETDTLRIVGAEAIARLEYRGKKIPPAEFVPILERNGMICVLDFYILEQVCKDIREWLKKGLEPVRISVNLSRKHLANPNLSEDIMDILHKYEMESRFIELELTETVEEAEAEQVISFMKKMKENGITLSIDDFGTGYSSLNLLRTFPVDVLKLDKTFLNSMEESDRIVLSNIIRMATELHMCVVVEGVDNWKQVDYLKQLNCKVVQGFLFDEPLPKDMFENKMKAGKYEKTA